MEIIKVPFTNIGKGLIGIIYRPYVPASLFSVKKKDWISVNMLVDSGADYTLLPRKYSIGLGIDLSKDCLVETTLGVGGSETIYIYKKLKIKINQWQKQIPVGFLERDDIPPLLGRLQCLEALELTFKKHQTFLS